MELRSVAELMDLLYACRGAAAPDACGGRADREDPTDRTDPTDRPDPADRTDPAGRADLLERALRTAALLRRRRPADKELQVAGLVLGVAGLLGPVRADAAGSSGAARAAGAVRALLGERVAGLVREQAGDGGRTAPPPDEDALTLGQAYEEARRADGPGAGVLEDWRTLLELVAARRSPLGAVD
ncbi:hypothetical protein [Streptomyces sp. NPDC046985]|uniref:hypothetical protein n=1 Tax=Streptomyces sp. NPDC046985 TaxID=3155377 RepID=UPI0033D18F40